MSRWRDWGTHMPTGQNEVKLPKAIQDTLARVFDWMSQRENQPAYRQAVQFGDMEFGHEVKQYLDPQDWKYIDPARASLIEVSREHPGVMGINTFGAGGPQTFGQHVLKSNMVYALGAENARPELWAHEFRHRNPRFDGYVVNNDKAEARNRMEDLFHANSPSSQAYAQLLWADWMRRQQTKKGSITEEELQKSIAHIMDLMLNYHSAPPLTIQNTAEKKSEQ